MKYLGLTRYRCELGACFIVEHFDVFENHLPTKDDESALDCAENLFHIGEWAEEPMIRAIAEGTCVTFEMWRSDGEFMTIVPDNPNGIVIKLAYHVGAHYNSLITIDNYPTRAAAAAAAPSPSPITPASSVSSVRVAAAPAPALAPVVTVEAGVAVAETSTRGGICGDSDSTRQIADIEASVPA